MGLTAEKYLRTTFFVAGVASICIEYVSSFLPPFASSSWCGVRVRHSTGSRGRCTSGQVTMERATGKFQKLAKPKFDPDNPNAVLGEIEVPGLKQVNGSSRRHVAWRGLQSRLQLALVSTGHLDWQDNFGSVACFDGSPWRKIFRVTSLLSTKNCLIMSHRS